jgi:hypothetical protein
MEIQVRLISVRVLHDTTGDDPSLIEHGTPNVEPVPSVPISRLALGSSIRR